MASGNVNAEQHGYTCIHCKSDNVRPTCRQWAVCEDCGKGMTEGEAMRCKGWWCDDCQSSAQQRYESREPASK